MILGTIWNFLSPRCGLRGIPTSVLGRESNARLEPGEFASQASQRLATIVAFDSALFGRQSPFSTTIAWDRVPKVFLNKHRRHDQPNYLRL